MSAAPWGDGALPDPALADAVHFEHVVAANARIQGLVRRTPVLTSDWLDRLTGARVLLKCENLQHIGAFKIRGAANAIARLTNDQRRAGVLAYSSGNHAQGIALAAGLARVKAVIVMPTNAPRAKLAATRELLLKHPAGGRVELYDPATTNRELLGRSIADRERLALIPPYDHPDVIAGQGTAALELFDQLRHLAPGTTPDLLFVCCGGGGLLSGCATVARALAPACRVIGVEPQLADDAGRSFRDRRLRTVTNPPTIADGTRTPYLGRYTFPIILERVDDMLAVTEPQIARATLDAMQRLKLVIEPSGALGIAGLLRLARQQPDALRGRTAAVIVSGGNMDLDDLPSIMRLAAMDPDPA